MESIYDIYVVEKSGIPVFAGCTATDYCKLHMDQHELQSGFLAAMYNFSKETFKDSTLRTINFDDITISMKSDETGGIILVFIHPVRINPKIMDAKLTKALEVFMSNFFPKLDPNTIDPGLFELYKDELRELRIIPPGMMNTMMQQKPLDIYKDQKPSLFRWLKSKLFN
ncbi:MAG: hypothetical protein ACC656_08705 [Candidatus Heimdallarchaeota archaeon]